MRIDLHNHTTWCHHATGSMQSYIEQAITQNIDVFGFSDHAPMDFDPKYRMSFDEMANYETLTRALKEQFKEHITLTLGYEVDYLKGHIDSRVLTADVDYLIGSVHFLDDWGFDNPEFIGRYEKEDIDAIYTEYFQAVEALAQSGYFQIVGHLDLIKVFKFYPSAPVLTLAHQALDAIKENDLTLELNAAGFRKPCKEAYPSFSLLQEAYKREIPITFGSDAHAIAQVGLNKEKLYRLAHDAGYQECRYFLNKEPITVTFS